MFRLFKELQNKYTSGMSGIKVSSEELRFMEKINKEMDEAKKAILIDGYVELYEN